MGNSKGMEHDSEYDYYEYDNVDVKDLGDDKSVFGWASIVKLLFGGQ
jgi:hypothetical protein